MNIWSMAKHENIKLLLISLQMQLGQENFSIADDKGSDYFAIVLEKPGQPQVRAYIFTYDRAQELFCLHLEYPRFAENGFSDNLMIYDEMSLQRMISALATHFDVSDHGAGA